MPRNPNLFESIKAYTNDALGMLREHNWGPDGLPTKIVPKVRIDDKSMSAAWASEVDWPQVLLPREKALEGLESYSAVTNAIRADPKVARHLDVMVGDGGSMVQVGLEGTLSFFLLHLLMRQNRMDFDLAKLSELYDEFEAYFYSDTVRRRLLSPIANFEMQGDRVVLGGGLTLRRLSIPEREALASQWAALAPLPMLFVGGWPTGREVFALDLSVEVPKIIQPPGHQPVGGGVQISFETFEPVILALRLFKAGGVDLTSVSPRSVGWDISGAGGSMLKGRSPVFGPKYSLSEEEVATFMEFWADFQRQRARKHNRTDLALRRFNSAYERLLAEDKLIDYVIALEALLMKAGEVQELGFHLALRGSILLGHGADARAEIFSRLKSAYGVRSQIVHGEPVPADVRVGHVRVPFHLFVDAVSDDVRRAIKTMLERTETASETEIIESLDERIVRGK